MIIEEIKIPDCNIIFLFVFNCVNIKLAKTNSRLFDFMSCYFLFNLFKNMKVIIDFFAAI